MDGGDSIRADLFDRDDMFYCYIYYGIFIYVLSVDVKGVIQYILWVEKRLKKEYLNLER